MPTPRSDGNVTSTVERTNCNQDSVRLTAWVIPRGQSEKSYIYMVDSHESDAFGPYFGKVHFLNIQNEQRLYITHSEAAHIHLINSQHFFCFCKFDFF